MPFRFDEMLMALTKLLHTTATFLIVEDDAITRDLMSSLATRMGFSKVWTALEGGEGLQIAARHKPTVIVTDLQMEPVDGLMLLGGLRASREWEIATVPVFFFTSHQDIDVVQRARNKDVTNFFIKPFNPGAFSEKLAEAAAKRFSEIARWKASEDTSEG